jgi:hypothetical protein
MSKSQKNGKPASTTQLKSGPSGRSSSLCRDKDRPASKLSFNSTNLKTGSSAMVNNNINNTNEITLSDINNNINNNSSTNSESKKVIKLNLTKTLARERWNILKNVNLLLFN